MREGRWTTVQESEYPWERAALAYLKELLPEAEPFRAWSNFEFIGTDGSINEVDLLVISRHRIFLVEIKSAPGKVEGDAGTWTWRDKRHVRTMDNPLLLANRKAKKLKSLLAQQPAVKRARLRVPYVEAVVFLSNRGLTCALGGPARQGILLRDDAPNDGYPTVGPVLRGERGIGSARSSGIDARDAHVLARALDEAGIRPSQAQRRVGDYVLKQLLRETDVYQDWEGQHVSFEGSRRRIRVYPNSLESSVTTRQERRRAAKREYRLLEGVVHDGILRVEGFTDHERGAALIFEHPDGIERFEDFARIRLEGLALGQRLALIRQLAETLRYAHARRLYHQALSPQSVLVADPEGERPQTKLFNWQVGTSGRPSETQAQLTVGQAVKVGLAGEAAAAVYLAPELHTVGALDPAAADVFALGALAYHVLTGQPPADSVEALHDTLRRTRGLLPSAVSDGVSGDLDALVGLATAPEASERPSVESFLAELDELAAGLHEPEADLYTHPLDAVKGDELEGGFEVRQRLGKGSTALALLVERLGAEGERQEGVLKVALSPELNGRIRQEASVLAALRHQNVVELYDEVEVSGHAALFVATAGSRRGDDGPTTYTLAQRIREEGRLSLDLLQRFGRELLGVLDWLEREGVSHRDIKPDNIGIGETPNGTLALVLFDFSLSGTPAENVRAGTPPYLDPFLGERKPPRWDPYAERFAAAMTLYEMTTGQLPSWGDGRSHPALVEGEAALDVELFDPSVREGLAAFFRRALARSYGERFDNAEQMRRAWERVFEGIDTPRRSTDGGTDDGDSASLAAALAEATDETPVAALPLTPRVLNALERMGVATLGDLHALPRIRLYRNKGIGQRTVREVRRLAEQVAERLAAAADTAASDAPPSDTAGLVPSEQSPEAPPEHWSVDLVQARLLAGKLDDDERAALAALLGATPDPAAPSDAPTDDARALELWPTQRDVAERLGLAREAVIRAVDRARTRWAKDRRGWVVPLRDEVARLLQAHAGVMTQRELVAALLASRGSSGSAAAREQRAAAAAFAALEVESARESARMRLYRGRRQPLVVATTELFPDSPLSPSERGRYADALGTKADELAAADPLLTPERALEELRAVEPPAGESPLTDDRLLRLAVAASAGAALSSRLEVYPRGMDAQRALKLGAGALLGPKRLPLEMVQQRIASRYPDAEPLPGRPQLDRMLEAEGLPLAWKPADAAYAPPSPFGSADGTGTLSRRTTTVAPHVPDAPGVGEAQALEDRLARVAPEGRLLALTVEPRHYLRAADELEDRFGLERVSLEGLLLGALREAADLLGASWDVVLRADAAAPTSRDWRRLQALVQKAMPAVETALLARERPALLLFPGLLARYGQLALIDRLREAAAEGRAPGAVLLIPADQQATMPVIDGEALPVVLASDWARIPAPWLRNAHRGHAPATA